MKFSGQVQSILISKLRVLFEPYHCSCRHTHYNLCFRLLSCNLCKYSLALLKSDTNRQSPFPFPSTTLPWNVFRPFQCVFPLGSDWVHCNQDDEKRDGKIWKYGGNVAFVEINCNWRIWNWANNMDIGVRFREK